MLQSRCYERKSIENRRFEGWVVSAKIWGRRGRQPFLHGKIGEWMPYNFVADRFHTKKHCSRLSSRKVHFLRKTAILRFTPLGEGGLEATYAVHLPLIVKPIYDFLLATNTNYCAISHRFQVIADYWSNFRSRQGVALLWRPHWGWFLRISG